MTGVEAQYWFVTPKDIKLNVPESEIRKLLSNVRQDVDRSEGCGSKNARVFVDVDIHLGFKIPDYEKEFAVLDSLRQFSARVFYIDTSAQFGRRDYFPQGIEEVVNGEIKSAPIYQGNRSAYVLDGLNIGVTGNELVAFVQSAYANMGLGEKAKQFITAIQQLPEPPKSLGHFLVEMHKHLVEESLRGRDVTRRYVAHMTPNVHNKATNKTDHENTIHQTRDVLFQPLSTVIRTKKPEDLMRTQEHLQVQSGPKIAFGPMQSSSYFST